MRLALIAAVSTAIGLAACVPVQPGGVPYGYGGVQQAPAAAPYGYYDGGYAPDPYYAPPGYGTPYGVPGPGIIVGGERRYEDRGQYRYNRPPPEGGFRGGPNQPPPNREFSGQPGRQNPGNARPGPIPAAAPRQAQPGPSPGFQRGGPSPGFQRGGPGGHAPDFNPANPTAQGGGDR